MSDESLRLAERACAEGGGGLALLALWKERRRAGVSSGVVYDFVREANQGDNWQAWTTRACKPGGPPPAAWDGKWVAYVFWRGEDHQDWGYDNVWWLVELLDGRFAFVSQLSSGTCSQCGQSSEDAAIGFTLEEVIRFGMGDDERRRAGLEEVAT